MLKTYIMSKFLFYPGVWLINNVVTVSGGQQRDSATHIRVSILPQEGRPSGTSGKEPACQCRRRKRPMGLISGSGRSPGGGHGNPLQYSCLENAVDRGPGQATVHGVTRLKRLSRHMHLPQTPLPCRLPHNIKQHSLCHTAGPCGLSVLNIAKCACHLRLP